MAEELINCDPGYAPHIEGTRIKVQQVAEFHTLYKWSPQEIANAFRLTLEQVHAALSYYYGHRDQIDAAIAVNRAEIERLPSVWEAPDVALTFVMTPQEIAQEYPITADRSEEHTSELQSPT